MSQLRCCSSRRPAPTGSPARRWMSTEGSTSTDREKQRVRSILSGNMSENPVIDEPGTAMRLSRKQRRVYEFLLENQVAVANLTLEELAAQLDVSVRSEERRVGKECDER